MITRTHDALVINDIANHPSIRPWIGPGSDPVDLSAAVQNEKNVALLGEHGAFLTVNHGGGIWEVHTMVKPEGRGKWSRMFCYEGATWLFCNTDCAEVLTRVPQGHTSAENLTRDMGFELQFVTNDGMEFQGNRVPVAIWSLYIQRWGLMSKTDMAHEGSRFYKWACDTLGHDVQVMDDDWYAVVGTTLCMLKGGQTLRGLVWYNRWAVSTRHPTLSVLNTDPIQINFGQYVLECKSGAFRVSPVN